MTIRELVQNIEKAETQMYPIEDIEIMSDLKSAAKEVEKAEETMVSIGACKEKENTRKR